MYRFRYIVSALWNSPSLCVFDWSTWRGTLIRNIAPRARRIPAKFNEAPRQLAARLPRGVKILLVHLDITDNAPFISDAAEFASVLSDRGIRALNCWVRDIRKRTLHASCKSYGLPVLAAAPTGPDNELLIVKTDLNSRGDREQLLSASQRAQFNLPARTGGVDHPPDYFVRRRGDLSPEVWSDPDLVVERYIQNPLNRFFRVYAAGDAIVISEGFLDTHIKRMQEGIRRFNYWYRRDGESLRPDLAEDSKVPPSLLQTAGVFLHRFRLDYGAADLVESETGEFFIVDVNKTPYWGAERQPGLVEHLRRGLITVARS
jgi:hypothetical protein